MKRLLVLLMVLICMFAVFANGGKEKSSSSSAETAVGFIPTGDAPEGKVQLVFWNSFSGETGQVIEAAAKEFNASQDKYEVQVIYTSSQATKVLSSTVSDRPNMFITSGNDSAKIISEPEDAKKYVPVQVYIDYDGYDDSAIFPNLKTTYSRNGLWQSLPIASTSVGIYYNVTVLQEHGIDYNTLTSLEAIVRACQKLKAEGVQTPIFYNTASVDYLNYFLCAEGLTWFNNDNGRDGVPTAHFLSEAPVHDTVLDHFKLIKVLADGQMLAPSELAVADRYGMFAKQDFPIMFNYSSVYVQTHTLVDNQFEFVYRPIMTVYDSSKNHGQAAGGSCVFIANVDDPWKEYGSWLFIKYLMQDKWTSEFALCSGYFPTTSTGAETAQYKEYVDTINPSAPYTLEAMNNTEAGVGYCLLPFASDYGVSWKNIMKKMMNTPEYSPEQAMEDFVKGTQDCLEMYWMSQGVLL
ncbi:MAG: extracellular solute-binding protein [Sphaerochaetaceae bacterium]|nr:extracellular solute-binding protein [Sphaerochaetaceae bacterium]